MPLDGSGTASKPSGSTAASGQTISSTAFNNLADDIYSILNTAKPISKGGTGATSASAARTALGLAIGSDVQAYSAVLAALITAFTAASASGPASLDFAEDADNGSNKVTLKAPASLPGDVTITLPSAAATLGPSTLGQHTIWVPAAAMTPNTTNGPASGSVETTTNKVMLHTLDFDASTEEFAQFGVQMPKSWDGLTLVAQFVWAHGSTTTNFGVTWGIEALALANDDAADTAWGTEVDTADTGGTTNDIYISPESSAVTVGNTPGSEEWVKFRVTRVVGDAGDTMAVDAKLIGVKIHYTTNAGTDD